MSIRVDGWSIEVRRYGDEQQPVIVIDGFAPAPERFVDDAGFLSFVPMGEFYPGIRANAPRPMLTPLIAALGPLIEEAFGYRQCAIAEAFYSLVTTPPSELAPIQRLPHFDGVEPERLALLHYVSRDERSGTAFYRHRTSGWESVDAARLDRYRTMLTEDVKRAGMPNAAYIAGDTAIFEQIGAIEGRFNRAVLYRGNTLHCALLPEHMTLSADPTRGRLTVNTFLTANF